MNFRKTLKHITLIIILLLPISISAKEDVVDSTPKLIIEGKATISKKADQLSITLGVITESTDAESALAENSTKMQRVIKSLQAQGLSQEEYQTGSFSIYPTYTPQPRNPSPDWKSEINGFRVNNNIQIKTDKLEIAGKLIDVASQAGANQVNQISFELKDPNSVRPEVIAAATKNAIRDAEALAKAAGLNLKGILNINLENAQPVTPLLKGNMMYAARSMDTSTPISSGDIDISTHVTIVYEVENQ